MKRADDELRAAAGEHGRGDDDRLSSLLATGHAPRAAATFAGPMDFGEDDDEISIEDFQRGRRSRPELFHQGRVWRAGRAVRRRCAGRTCRRRCAKSLWDVPGVACVTDRGTIRARAVIVTASPAVLAFEEIEFSPDLPDAHVEAFFDLPMGMLTKLPIEIRGTRLGLAALRRPADRAAGAPRHLFPVLSLRHRPDGRLRRRRLRLGNVGGGRGGGRRLRHRPALRHFRQRRAKACRSRHDDQLGRRALRARRLCRGTAGPGGRAPR